MISFLDVAMTVFTGGTFGTMLYLSFKVGHLQGCIEKVVTTCEYLNHRTTAIEGCLRGLLAQSGGAIMLIPPIGTPPVDQGTSARWEGG